MNVHVTAAAADVLDSQPSEPRFSCQVAPPIHLIFISRLLLEVLPWSARLAKGSR